MGNGSETANRGTNMTPRFCLFLITVALLAPTAFAGPQWVEMSDAGKTPLTAELIVGGGLTLQTISGELTGAMRGGTDDPDLADMYIFQVTQPMVFRASTQEADGGAAEFDSNLWLFRLVNAPLNGFGLLATRDTAAGGTVGARMGNAATDGTGAMLLTPGRYALAISGGDHIAISNGGPIFNFATPTEVSGPDGPGGTQPQVDFVGPGETGTYTIALGGSAPISPDAVPAVSDVGLVIMAMILLCAGTLVFRRRPTPACPG